MNVEHEVAKADQFTRNKDDADNERWLNKIDAYFKEAGELKFVPRAARVDLEAGSLDVIKVSPTGIMFKPDNFVFGEPGAGNNWAKGHYTEGAKLFDEVVVIRKKGGSCNYNYLKGFEIRHSLGGGRGSGLGTFYYCK